MTAFFKFMDNLPIVRLLQICAVLNLLISIVLQVTQYGLLEYDFTVSPNSDLDAQWNFVWSALIMVFANFLKLSFEALIMLGMAELIKLMKEKKEEK